jgi:hypothetical protein
VNEAPFPRFRYQPLRRPANRNEMPSYGRTVSTRKRPYLRPRFRCGSTPADHDLRPLHSQGHRPGRCGSGRQRLPPGSRSRGLAWAGAKQHTTKGKPKLLGVTSMCGGQLTRRPSSGALCHGTSQMSSKRAATYLSATRCSAGRDDRTPRLRGRRLAQHRARISPSLAIASENSVGSSYPAQNPGRGLLTMQKTALARLP